MIDRKTGNIEVASGKVINPSMSFEEVIRMGLGESQAEKDIGNGWVWHDVKNVKIDDQYFNISFAFYNNKLNTITLVFSNTKYDSNKGSEPWSEKEELQKAIIFNNWLFAEVGSERTFNWGQAGAGYDPKGGFSSIVIRYKN
jgi:hypothetical protein